MSFEVDEQIFKIQIKEASLGVVSSLRARHEEVQRAVQMVLDKYLEEYDLERNIRDEIKRVLPNNVTGAVVVAVKSVVDEVVSRSECQALIREQVIAEVDAVMQRRRDRLA